MGTNTKPAASIHGHAAALELTSVNSQGGASAVAALLDRMRDGDRDAAAEFVMRFGSRLKRRIRGKLNPAMRRIFDSQEILSTIGRRLDMYVRDRQLEAGNEQQLWALVLKMADNAVVDKWRVFQRLQRTEGEDAPFAQDLLRRLKDREARSDLNGVEIEIERAIQLFSDRLDRQVLSYWLVGMSLKDIALYVDLTPAAVRQRWHGIRSRLSEWAIAEMND